MKVSLASCAELYAEHRRTASPRKRARIAAELQRRHDEQFSRPGYGNSWWGSSFVKVQGTYGAIFELRHFRICRFEFALWLPSSFDIRYSEFREQ